MGLGKDVKLFVLWQKLGVALSRGNVTPFLEEKGNMTVIEQLIASFIERALGNKVTTLIGLLGSLLFAYNQLGGLVPAKYAAYVQIGAVLVMGVALILAKDAGLPASSVPSVNNLTKIGVLLMVIFIAPQLYAQTATPAPTPAPTPTTPMFSGSSDAVAFHFNGEWTAATLVGQHFDLLDLGAKKTNHLSLVGNELVAPGASFDAYLGGLRFEPDLSPFLAKTNVPAGTFGIYLEGSAGNGVPSSGGSHISFLAGGGVKYRATASLSWNALEAQYVRFGSQQGAILSSGLSFVFGSK